jgi:twitching motility protein PilU
MDGTRTAAIEILLGTQLVRDLIHKGDIHSIKEAMEKSENVGMQTFDSHLLRLFKQGTISLEEALQNSDSPNNLKLKINLSAGLGSVSPAGEPDRSKNDPLGNLSLQAIHKDEEPEETQ